MTPSKTAKHWLPALDGLRAVAILLVLFHHLAHYIAIDGEAAIFRAVAGTGWNGVYLFFVLSGFLVGSIAFRELQQTGSLNVRAFWIRRFMRTWPLYFVLLGVHVWRAPEAPSPSIWYYLTFTQNLVQPQFFLQTWSLAVEEQFYLFLPLLLAAAWRWPKLRLFGITFFSLFVVAYLYRWLYGNGFYRFLHTFSVVDSLLVGVGLGYLHVYKPQRLEWLKRYPNLCLLAGLVFVYGAHFTQWNRFWQTNFNFGGLAIGFGLILIAALSEKLLIRRVLVSRPMRFIALVSYSIYLSHDQPLYYAARLADSMALQGWAKVAFLVPVVTIVSVALGWVLYQIIEKPGLAIRDYYWPKRESKFSNKKIIKGLSRLRTSTEMN